MKRSLAIYMTLALSLLLISCGNAATDPEQSVNPLVEVSSLDALSNTVGFEVTFPQSINGFGEITSMFTTEDQLAQVTYGSTDRELVLSKGIENDSEDDVSDGNDDYEFSTKGSSAGRDITLRGDSLSSIRTATWTDGEYVYTAVSSTDLTVTEMLAAVGEVST